MKLARLRPRSLTATLALLFFGITSLAFAVVIFVFLPRLETRLEDKQLDELQSVADSSAPDVQRLMTRDLTGKSLDDSVAAIADRVNARVTVLGVQRSNYSPAQYPERFYVITDSNVAPAVSPNLDLARRALTARERVVTARDANSGQAAQSLSYRGNADWVAIYERPFEEAATTVELVRSRLLWASVAALTVALLAGFLLSRVIADRVRSVERAARNLAAGRPTEPLPVNGDDELASLALAFNEMQYKLGKVDRARREFIANASHELRTPIFSLGGFVELLEDEEMDEDTRREFLATMREQVDRLQKLAVDLLDLSRLDAGSVAFEREDVDLGVLAEEVTREFGPASVQHGTKLELALPDDRVGALCDRERVAQIMRILLDNALRHTPEGTPVTVSAGLDNGSAEFAVSDRGPGVDPGSRDQLFERFYTGDKASGSGLGLAIAKELAERMDGRIEVASGAGATTFSLELPTAPLSSPSNGGGGSP